MQQRDYSMPPKSPKARKAVKKPWNPEELRILKRDYKNTPNDQLAKNLRRSVPSVQRKAFNMGLTKTKKYMREQYNSRRKRGKGDRKAH